MSEDSSPRQFITFRRGQTSSLPNNEPNRLSPSPSASLNATLLSPRLVMTSNATTTSVTTTVTTPIPSTGSAYLQSPLPFRTYQQRVQDRIQSTSAAFNNYFNSTAQPGLAYNDVPPVNSFVRCPAPDPSVSMSIPLPRRNSYLSSSTFNHVNFNTAPANTQWEEPAPFRNQLFQNDNPAPVSRNQDYFLSAPPARSSSFPAPPSEHEFNRGRDPSPAPCYSPPPPPSPPHPIVDEPPAIRCPQPNCQGPQGNTTNCFRCNGSFHNSCVGLPEGLQNTRNFQFNCNLCLEFRNIEGQLAAQTQALQNLSVSHPPTMRYKPLPINIPKFYGNPENDPNEFIEKCESNLVAAACPPDQWLYAVTPNLKDRAKDWWVAQKLNCVTWQDFVDRFTRFFNGPSQLVRAQAQLYGEAQLPTESCESFIAKKLQMWRRLNQHLPDHHAIAPIIQLMRPSIRPYLITTPPTSIDQLLSISSDIERDCQE